MSKDATKYDLIDTESCVVLWREVLNLAFLDASWDPKLKLSLIMYKQKHIARCHALLWFGEKSKDFHEVCENCGFDPEFIHDIARKKYGKLLYDLSSLSATPNTRKRSTR